MNTQNWKTLLLRTPRATRISAALLLLLFILGWSYPFWTDLSIDQTRYDQTLLQPSWQHWFGTDSLGRDLFVRVLHASRVSILIGIITSAAAVVIGLIMGSIAGYWGGLMDRILMRSLDVLMSIPQLVLIALLQLFFIDWNPLITLCLIMSLTSWMSVAKTTRNMVFKIKVEPYIESARALGAHPFRILLNHVLRNIYPSAIAILVLQIPYHILYESFLSFMGIGLKPPEASFGVLINEGWRTMSLYPHLIFIPSLVLFLTILCLQESAKLLKSGDLHFRSE